METAFILIASIKIKCHCRGQATLPGKKERVVGSPFLMSANIVQVFIVRLFVYGRHVSPNMGKHAWMQQRIPECYVTAG